MKQGYFNYNGNTYTTGTVIKIKPRKNKYGLLVDQATFRFCAPAIRENGEDWYIVWFGPEDGIVLTEKNFYNSIEGIISTENAIPLQQAQSELNPKMRKPTFTEELEIDGMLVAWIWYVFLMLIVTVFHDRIVGWIGISIIFFRYRRKKIKEAGYL